MKRLLSIITILFLFSCTENKVKSDIEKINLKGRIKSLTESSYSTIEKFGEIQKDRLDYKQIYRYDTNGRLTEDSWYGSDGNLLNGKTFEYDGNGNLIRKTQKYEDKENNSDFFAVKNNQGVYIYKYNKNNQITEENWYKFDGSLIHKTIYTYKEYIDKNKIIEKTSVYSDTAINESVDERGNKTEKKVTYSNKDKDEYDNNGNLISHEEYFFETNLLFRIIYKYDNNGKLTEQTKLNNKGNLISKESYLYDKKENLIEKDELGYHNTFQYNEKRFMTEECAYNSDGKLVLKVNYNYDEIDKKGNWLKRRETGFRIMRKDKNGDYVPIMNTDITERKIEYY